MAALIVLASGKSLAGPLTPANSTNTRLDRLEATVVELRARNAVQEVQIARLRVELGEANARAAQAAGEMAALKANPVLALGPYVSLHTETINDVVGPHVVFEGVNVHVRDGTGATYTGLDPTAFTGTPSGRGNLFIGYNERSETDPTIRGGAHCLVVGAGHSYTSWAGFVAGGDNSILGLVTSVLGGNHNVAESPGSCISGGAVNRTRGPAWHQSISGGGMNTTGGWASSISGGMNNETSLDGSCEQISGGFWNTAFGFCAGVAGGHHNAVAAEFASVVGGEYNIANGASTTVSGGACNTASDNCTSVSGGWMNLARGFASSVSGGENNVAAADMASVSGGSSREAADADDWRAGNLLEDN